MNLARPSRALWRLALALLPLAAVAEGAAAPPFGEEVEVVGVRPRAAAADPTAAATVVEVSRFAGETKSVAELLITAPGVAVNQYGGLGQLATVSIRGSTSDQVPVFLDGVPLSTGAGGGVDLSRIPRAWIERIEVVRGAEGAVYGMGALGGAVNIITRPAAAGTWSAEASGGSFRTFAGSADVAVGSERWGLLGAAAAEGTQGNFDYLYDQTPALPGDQPVLVTRTHDAAFTVGGLLKGYADLGSGRLDAVVQLSGGHRDLPGPPSQPSPGDGQRDGRAGAVVRWAQPLADGLEIRLAASGRDDRLTVTIAPSPEARQRDLEADASAELLWTAGPSTLSLRTSASAERLSVEGAEDHARQGFALGLADDLALAGGRLRLTPALRWDALGPFHGLSAKLGAALQVAGPISFRASVGRGFRAPSFAELYLSQGQLSANPDLVPETSVGGDVGVVVDGRRGLAAVTLFAQQYQDLIVYEPDSFRRYKPFNDGKAATRGLEVELASAPLGPAGLALSGAYTLLLTETLRGEAAVLGKALPHRARHRLFARLAAGGGPLAGHVEAHALSEQFPDLRNSPSIRIPPALTFNAGGSFRFARHPDARLALELRNLLDDRTLQDGFANPLPGRTVMLTVRIAGGKDTP